MKAGRICFSLKCRPDSRSRKRLSRMTKSSLVVRVEKAYSTSVSPSAGLRSDAFHVLPTSSSTWRSSSGSPARCFSSLRAVSRRSAIRFA
ncbi:hypothetical protein BE04_00070 [Sorangium cellulosum]|uniref:Uncharacterized protein n=1 Tax=Sorangium cellulosum TaxID=56 RepID=A0A150P9C9_SORCE|nr:hypothetical protein BE04_00070 [Sorangium cellulosum]